MTPEPPYASICNINRAGPGHCLGTVCFKNTCGAMYPWATVRPFKTSIATCCGCGGLKPTEIPLIYLFWIWLISSGSINKDMINFKIRQFEYHIQFDWFENRIPLVVARSTPNAACWPAISIRIGFGTFAPTKNNLISFSHKGKKHLKNLIQINQITRKNTAPKHTKTIWLWTISPSYLNRIK